MSLAKYLAKMGPEFGFMYGRGAQKLGLKGLGKDIATLSIKHPITAGVLGHVPPLAGSVGAIKGAEKLDEALMPDEEMTPELRRALKKYGQNPKDYESGHRMPLEGAVTGGIIGASLGGPGKLAKYLAIGAAGGGGIGALAKKYKRREEED
jgi:hypothetical protein